MEDPNVIKTFFRRGEGKVETLKAGDAVFINTKDWRPGTAGTFFTNPGDYSPRSDSEYDAFKTFLGSVHWRISEVMGNTGIFRLEYLEDSAMSNPIQREKFPVKTLHVYGRHIKKVK